ncbi:MAG: hypothetical protein ACKOD3_08770, partial [Phenylobacterium sp.]
GRNDGVGSVLKMVLRPGGRGLQNPGLYVCAPRLGAVARRPAQDPVLAQAHRWRYARSAAGSDLALWSATTRLGCCGDWLAGPRVECAWDSGEALALKMGERLRA